MAAKLIRTLGSVILLAISTLAQQPATQATSGAASGQSVSASGILPVYGVDFGSDLIFFDSQAFPSKSPAYPHSGASPSVQRTWNTLKSAGFSMMRFEVDLADMKSAVNRTANLCAWAKTNNVFLIISMRQSEQSEYAADVSTFAQTLASMLGSGDTKPLYEQVALYELGADWNNPSLRKKSNQDALLKAAAALRKAEGQISQGIGVSVKPIVVGASLDYEMISAKAIAGTSFDGEPAQHGYSSLLAYLKPLAASSDIDIIFVAWFPGTLSAGGADKVPTIVSRLDADLNGKQVLLRTGFSSTFHSREDQQQYFLNTFSGLASLRATSPADNKFIGVIFEQALNGPIPAANTNFESAKEKWDWPSRADELAAMWRGEHPSPEMSWWLASLTGGLGLVNAQADAVGDQPQTSAALEALNQISQAVASAAASTPAAPQPQPAETTSSATSTPPPSGMPTSTTQSVVGANSLQAPTGSAPMGGTAQPSAMKGFMSQLSQTLQAKSNQGLGSMLDGVFQRLGNKIQTVGTGTGSTRVPASTQPTYQPYSQPAMQSPATGMDMPTAGMMPANSFTADVNPSMPGSADPMNTMPTPSAGGAMPLPSAGNPVGMTPLERDSPSATAPISTPPAVASAKPISNPTQPSGTPIKVTATPIAASVAPVTSKPVLGRPHSAQLQAGPTRTNLPNAESDLTATAPSPAAVTPSTATLVTTTSALTNSAKLADPKPTAPNIATSAPSIPAQVPVSFAKVGDLVPQGPMFAGQPAQLSLPITNPNQVALNNVRAMLMIDGRQAQSEPIATLMPMETRTVIFQQVIVPQPGPHQVKIGIQLQRPDSRPQMGMFNQMLTVQAAPGGVSTQVSGLAAGVRQPAVSPVTKAGITTVTPNSALNRTNPATTPASTVATLRPATDPSPVTGSPVVGKKTPATTTEVNANHRPELTLTSVDLSYSPTAAVVGQPVDFHVVVRNSSEAPAKVGTLVLKLVSDGKLILMTQPAIQFSLAPNATYQANWRAVMPTGTRIEFVASVSADGVEVPGRSQASILLKTQPPIQAPVKPGKRRP